MGASDWSALLPRQININQDEDPRKGSAREGSDGGTLSQTAGSKSSSLAKLGATFIPVSIYLVICVLLFIVLRKKLSRVYSPRTIRRLRYPERTSPELPQGWFQWILPFFKIEDTHVLNNGSIDGFFFLRFLRIIRNICLIGVVITWPVLFPINATGGNGLQELERLSMGNIAPENNDRLFAHAVIACFYFSVIIFMIIRESIYFINLRQAYLSSPYYAERLSARTLMLLSVPDAYLDEHRLRKLYGDSVRGVWIPKTMKELTNAVKERQQTMERLEKAEIALIKKANAARNKQMGRDSRPSRKKTFTQLVSAEKHDGKHDTSERSHEHRLSQNQNQSASTDEVPLPSPIDTPSLTNRSDWTSMPYLRQVPIGAQVNQGHENSEYHHPYGYDPDLPDVRGSVAAQWLPAEQRPRHRPLGSLFRKKDTIGWTRARLKELNLQIWKLRRAVKRDESPKLKIPAAFVEFDTQEAAQAAQQVLTHHSPLQMTPRLLGVRPDEVVWSALAIPWWQRIARRFAVMGLITAAIIFWSIPSAFVGVLSSVEFLSEKIPFLYWLPQLPGPILGFIQGFVPAAALSFFMSLVPAMLRVCARVAGVPSVSKVELFTQTAYFAFQIVQVFLITTLTSAASTAFVDVLKDPLSAKDLLAENLPQASNFYLSYIMIQCLANGATSLIHPFDLLRHLILPKLSDLPRTHYKLWKKMLRPWWGKEFPVVSNLAVIAISYSVISPLVLIFAAAGMAFMHFVWRYNLIYVLDSSTDSHGLFYPRALLHLIVGMYVATVCLIGLFAINFAFGPMALMVIFLVVASLVHISLNDAISPFLSAMPQTLKMEEQIQEEERSKEERQEANDARREAEGAAASYFDEEEHFGDETGDGHETPPTDDEDDGDHQVTGTRGVEGAHSVKDTLAAFLHSKINTRLEEVAESTGIDKHLRSFRLWAGIDRSTSASSPPSAVAKFLHPEIYEGFLALRKLLPSPDELPDVTVPPSYKGCQYLPPEMWMTKPEMWIPEDEARVSKQEVAHSKKLVKVSDHGAKLEGEGLRIVVSLEEAPFDDHRLLL